MDTVLLKHFVHILYTRSPGLLASATTHIVLTRVVTLYTEELGTKSGSGYLHIMWHSPLSNFLHDRKYRWATCPTGYFVQELYRNSGNGISNIEAARCCKPCTHPNRYGRCQHKDVSRSFDNAGTTKCDEGYYLAGIYKGNCNRLYCIERFKCCKMDV